MPTRLSELKKQIKTLWKSEGQEKIAMPQDYDADFILTYKHLKVVSLSLHE